ncbi:MAG: class I SAM-dependent rRNA methyltransferase [Deltaproteobacteria bacterium]|nr:class I SAM-dependent rRNA methyltransferase [Deltaproteobacteria bacterium]
MESNTIKQTVENLIDSALQKRQLLVESFAGRTNAWRLLNSGADGVEGVTVDILGDVLLVEQHREHAAVTSLIDVLATRFPQKSVFLKKRWSTDTDARSGAQVAGPKCAAVMDVVENGLRFLVRLLDEEHVGIFLDSRLPREWVHANSRDKRVLNLFSYTGGFGMVAAAAGAKSTVNIDNKNSALHFAMENYRRNGLPFDDRTFFKCDVLYFLKRAAGQKGRFDLIVVDPPPRFKRRKQRDFMAHRDYGTLLAMCVSVLADNGVILAGLNALRASDDRMSQMIEAAAVRTGRTIETVDELKAHMDFPPTPDRPTARFRVLRVGA